MSDRAAEVFGRPTLGSDRDCINFKRSLTPNLFGLAAAILLAACNLDAPLPTIVGEFKIGIPDGWSGAAPSGYRIGLTSDKHGGSEAVFISGNNAGSPNFAVITQSLRADSYRGKRVRFSAWAKQQDVAADVAGLWLRVDGPGQTLAFDNMTNRPLTGNADWHQVSVVLDVANDALGFSFGALLHGAGALTLDDMQLEIVGAEVALTNADPPHPSSDSAAVATAYLRSLASPVNLDFEGIVGSSLATVTWLTENTVTLSGTDPTQQSDDLQPLEGMIGSAHVVGMGEGTHGTRDFFLLKHRVFEFLVRQMGFTRFAIEATSPEADDVNRYVLGGDGDPKKLLSHLYFWTWNTQEVLDLILWMRQWNSTASASQRVQFAGIDMQFPGASMDSVAAFIARVDPASSGFIDDHFSCITPFRNHFQLYAQQPTVYAARDSAAKAACAADLQSVYDLIAGKRAAYEPVEPNSYETVLHHARLVQQFEAWIALSNNLGLSSFARDKAMAENVIWIKDHSPPGTKIALWAHNQHVNAIPNLMGGYLRAKYAADYLALGFLFGHGRFNAVSSTGQISTFDAELVPDNSLESLFLSAGKNLALFDTRQIASGGATAAPLAGPILMRAIGSTFFPTSEASFFAKQVFPNDFDLLIFVRQTTESTRLPFAF
jgi:erythromycin esterase